MKNYEIVQTEQIAERIKVFTLNAPLVAKHCKPGQFVMVRAAESLDPLLRRPFSIHSRGADGSLSLLFKVVGKGTALLAKAKPGDTLDLLGPLGRGFDLTADQPVCLIGGGMGMAMVIER